MSGAPYNRLRVTYTVTQEREKSHAQWSFDVRFPVFVCLFLVTWNIEYFIVERKQNNQG